MAQLSKESTKLWVNALRSGKYKQTRGTLKEDFGDGTFGYCCLGVLLSVLGEEPYAEVRNGTKIFEGSRSFYYTVEGLIGDWLQTTLVRMNDNKGASFLEIADEIERELL